MDVVQFLSLSHVWARYQALRHALLLSLSLSSVCMIIFEERMARGQCPFDGLKHAKVVQANAQPNSHQYDDH